MLRRLLTALALAGLPFSSQAISTSVSAPTAVASGASYFVSAYTNYDGDGYTYIYKNGGYFSDEWGASTEDWGTQEIYYSAEAYDYWSGNSDYSGTTVQVVEGNQGPSPRVQVDGYGHGNTVVRPYGGSVTVTVWFIADDVNGNLVVIRPQIWHPDSGYFTNDGGAWTYRPGSYGDIGRTVTLDRDGDWYFWTDALDSLDEFRNSGAWGDGFRLTVVEALPPTPPTATVEVDGYSSGATVTRPLGGSVAVTVRYKATDPNGNLSWIRPQTWSPDYYFDNNAGNGIGQGGSYGEVVRTVYLDRAGDWYFWTDAADTDHGGYFDSGSWTNAFRLQVVDAANQNPSLSPQILDGNGNPIALDGNGRARVPTNANFYIRVNGSDPEGRLARLYSRLATPSGVGFAYEDVAVSGSSASYTFGPYNAGNTVGVWDVWTHVHDADQTGYQWQGGGWWGSHTPDIEVYDNQAPSTPGGLSESSVGYTSFTLNWGSSSDNVGVTAYEVSRSGTSLGTVGGTSISVTGLGQGTTYTMTVRARDAAGNWSGWSAPRNVTTGADPNLDSDGDGMPDMYEQAYGLNPYANDAAVVRANGLTNYQNYLLGINPATSVSGSNPAQLKTLQPTP